MTNNTTADTTASGAGEIERWSPARIFAEEASVLGTDAMGRDPNGDYVEFEDYDTLRAQLEAAEAEKREAWAAVESKAGWEWKKRAEAAEAEVARLGAVLDRIAGYTLSQFAGPCDMVVQCVHDAMAARTEEAAP